MTERPSQLIPGEVITTITRTGPEEPTQTWTLYSAPLDEPPTLEERTVEQDYQDALGQQRSIDPEFDGWYNEKIGIPLQPETPPRSTE